MRAKEYVNLHRQELKYAELVSESIKDLLPIRKSKDATSEYMNTHLFADMRYQHYLLQKNLYERGNAIQPEEPRYEEIDGEISMDIAAEVREELFRAIEQDDSFGYLFYILGTEQNSKRNSEPIDCIPNAERIVQGIIENRDDYPKDCLDGYINENVNYQQYCVLIDGHYWDDDDALYLKYFNRVYEIYDELRLRKNSISSVKSYLGSCEFESDTLKYWTFAFIITLIEESEEGDDCLKRCKHELSRIVDSLKGDVIKATLLDDEVSSPVYLNKKKGNKLDVIRVFNSLYELGLFVDAGGGKLTKKDYFIAAGKFMNVDLEHYDKDLSSSMQSCVAYDKQARIFDEMKKMHQEIFNSKL